MSEQEVIDFLNTSIWAIKISNKKKNSKEYYKDIDKLAYDLEQRGKDLLPEPNPEPFYKEGDDRNTATPAGYVLKIKNIAKNKDGTKAKTELLVVYHGTRFFNFSGSAIKEVFDNARGIGRAKFTPGDHKSEVEVHSGYLSQYLSSKDSLHKILKANKEDCATVSFSGHSLGSAVGIIAALDVACNDSRELPKVGQVSGFGGPLSLYKSAGELYKKMGLREKTHLIYDAYDFVPSTFKNCMRQIDFANCIVMKGNWKIPHKRRNYEKIVGGIKKLEIEESIEKYSGFVSKLTLALFKEYESASKAFYLAYERGGSKEIVDNVKAGFKSIISLKKKTGPSL